MAEAGGPTAEGGLGYKVRACFKEKKNLKKKKKDRLQELLRTNEYMSTFHSFY